MKKIGIQQMVCAAVVLFLSSAGFAQEIKSKAGNKASTSRKIEQGTKPAERRITRLETLGRTLRTGDVIGAAVKNYDEEKIATVDNLAVEVETGRIVQVIVSIGGFLGLGDKWVAVPPDALYCDPLNKTIYLNADKEKLKGAPKFEMSRWDELMKPDQFAAANQYFGTETEGESERLIHEGSSPVTAGNISIQKATKVKGMTVKNLQDQRLGNVEDLVLDLCGGRVVAMIISSGGFLGIGDELSAVPPAAFRFNAKEKELQLDVTKESLSKAPHFRSTEWPDMNQPGYASEFHRAYGIEPYFYSNPMTGRDNTAQNARDREGGPVTPADQGNSLADRDRTALIRKAVVSRKDLSVNAHNINIITRDGCVTLRGPVNSEEEKRAVETIANGFAHKENVNNQLEVK